MVMLFTSTFQSPYYDNLMGNLAWHFYEVVRIAEKIEQVIKMKKLEVLPWIPEQVREMNQKMTLRWKTLVVWSNQISLQHQLLKCLC
jgi:hypothetical protein